MESKLKVKAPTLSVTGTVAVDDIKTPFGEQSSVFGGSASYFSYASSFFTDVGVVAVVGEDFPKEYRKVLEEREIDLSHLQTISGKTFHWKGKYEGDMNAAITLDTELNVLADFDPILDYETTPPYVFLANVDPDLQLKVLDQLPRNEVRFTACDTMNFWIESKRDSLLHVLARVDMAVLNDGEARQLTGEQNLITAAHKVRDLGPQYVMIKKGEHGCVIAGPNQLAVLPAYPLEEVFDPTGAGDTFAGGVMGYLSTVSEIDFQAIKKAAAYGTVVASFTVEKFGLDRLRTANMNALDERLRVFKDLTKID